MDAEVELNKLMQEKIMSFNIGNTYEGEIATALASLASSIEVCYDKFSGLQAKLKPIINPAEVDITQATDKPEGELSPIAGQLYDMNIKVQGLTLAIDRLKRVIAI